MDQAASVSASGVRPKTSSTHTTTSTEFLQLIVYYFDKGWICFTQKQYQGAIAMASYLSSKLYSKKWNISQSDGSTSESCPGLAQLLK